MGELLFVSTHPFTCLRFWVNNPKRQTSKWQPCSASTQVTTTTLQKNLTEKIKWYMTPLGKNVNNIFLTKLLYRKNILHKKILTKKILTKKIYT